MASWFGVRCVFETIAAGPGAPGTYEERITIWQATDLDAAIALAEAEAAEYAALVDDRYLGLAQAYAMTDEPRHGAETYSLMRDSQLPPAAYLDAFFDTGAERQQGEYDTADRTHVWIFHGDQARYASGVFLDQATALAWIERHALTGILTQYPAGDGCYHVAIRDGSFRPTKPHHGTPGHVAGFSPSQTTPVRAATARKSIAAASHRAWDDLPS